jgi:hypothetical protein
MGGIVLAQDIRIKVTAKQCQVKDFPLAGATSSLTPRGSDWRRSVVQLNRKRAVATLSLSPSIRAGKSHFQHRPVV